MFSKPCEDLLRIFPNPIVCRRSFPGKLKPQDVVTEIAKRWSALSDDEKAEWNEKAKTPEVSEEEE